MLVLFHDAFIILLRPPARLYSGAFFHPRWTLPDTVFVHHDYQIVDELHSVLFGGHGKD